MPPLGGYRLIVRRLTVNQWTTERYRLVTPRPLSSVDRAVGFEPIGHAFDSCRGY
jgi:hypothetical protein